MIATISLAVLILCAVGAVICIFALLARHYEAKRDAQIKRTVRPTGNVLPPLAQDRGLAHRRPSGGTATYRYGGPPSGTITGRISYAKPAKGWDVREALPRVEKAFGKTFEKLAKRSTEDEPR